MATDTPVPTDALLPCPFCGANASGYEIAPHSHSGPLKALGIPDHGGSYVIEGDCKCGSGLIGATQAEVTARWNRRAQPARLEVDASGKPHIVRLAEDFAEDCIRAGYVTTKADSHHRLMDAARAQPAPAASQAPMSDRFLGMMIPDSAEPSAFVAGVRFAEAHHGIKER